MTTDDSTPNTSTPEGRGAEMAKFAMTQPDKVPAKFRKDDGTVDVDALTTSYVELERRMSGAGTTSPAEASPPASVEDFLTPPAPEAPATPADTSLDEALGLSEPEKPTMQAVFDEVKASIESGEGVPEALLKQATDVGIPADLITRMNDDRVRRVEDLKAKATQIAGSQENVAAAMKWAKDNLSVDHRKQLVQQLQGPNAEMVMTGLVAKARESGALGEVGALQDADTGIMPSANARIKPFTDFAEQQAAMSDPRYGVDPEYRKLMMKRRAVTKGMDPSVYDNVPIT